MSEERPGNQDELIFYYSREERLKNAPRSVKNYYNGNMKTPPKGLIKVLVATKGSRIMFLTLVFLTALGIALSLVEKTSNSDKRDGIHYSLNAFSFDEMVYVSLKLDENQSFKKSESIDVSFIAKDSTGTVAAKNTDSGTYSGKELFFRTTFYDYDIIEIGAVIQVNGNDIVLSTPVEKQ